MNKSEIRAKYKSLRAFFAETRSYSSEFRPSGFVYLLYDETSGLTKIGKTRLLRARCEELTRKRHQEIIFLFAFNMKNSDFSHDKVERYLHCYYDSERVTGEWFNLSIKNIFEILKLSVFLNCKVIREMPQSPVTLKYVRSFENDIRKLA